MPLIALKPFLDGKGRLIAAGEALPDDYDEPTLAHYARLGMAGEGKAKVNVRKPTGAAETKPAAPAETKASSDVSASSTGAEAGTSEGAGSDKSVSQ
jgi:hypothetical protein